MRDYFTFKARELLGKKSLKKGEVIVSSEPFAYVIDSQHRGEYCDHCLVSHNQKPLKPCKDCRFVWYCSEHCYFAGSDIHQHECRPLKRLDPFVPESFARLMYRSIIRLKKEGEKYVSFYTEKKFRRFKDLTTHYKDIRNDEKRMQDVNHITKVLKMMFDKDEVLSESDFISLYGRLLVNRFCLMDSQMNPIGSVVYVGASIFDHSCRPNAYASFEGKNVVIRSLVDWKELDLNKVYISYVDLLSSTYYRREELKDNWYFWCYCPLCTDKDRNQFENCMKCENPECRLPVLVPEKPDSLFVETSDPEPECSYCGWTVSEERLEEYHSAVAYTRHRLRALRESDPAMDLCLSVLDKQADNFSSMNVWRVKALDCAFNAAYHNGIFSRALEYGRSNLEAMKIYYGLNHPTFGLFLMKFGKILLYLKEHKEGLQHVKEAESILTIALGPRHRLITEEIPNLKIMANEDIEILLENRVAEKEREEHELVCKHCGRRKGKAVNASVPPPKAPEKKKTTKEDVNELIELLDKVLLEAQKPVEKKDTMRKDELKEGKYTSDTYISTLRENGVYSEFKRSSRRDNGSSEESSGTADINAKLMEASLKYTELNNELKRIKTSNELNEDKKYRTSYLNGETNGLRISKRLAKLVSEEENGQENGQVLLEAPKPVEKKDIKKEEEPKERESTFDTYISTRRENGVDSEFKGPSCRNTGSSEESSRTSDINAKLMEASLKYKELGNELKRIKTSNELNEDRKYRTSYLNGETNGIRISKRLAKLVNEENGQEKGHVLLETTKPVEKTDIKKEEEPKERESTFDTYISTRRENGIYSEIKGSSRRDNGSSEQSNGTPDINAKLIEESLKYMELRNELKRIKASNELNGDSNGIKKYRTSYLNGETNGIRISKRLAKLVSEEENGQENGYENGIKNGEANGH